MTTIVSAFISNINIHDKTFDNYYLFGKLILKSTTPKIIFLDENMYNLIQDDDYDKNNTLLIKYDKTNIYLYTYIETLHNFSLTTNNPKKDTLEYMFTICNKTEFMREAIEKTIFNTKNFVWIDFGIKHVFNCSDEEFIEKLNNLYLKEYNKVRIANIWNLSIKYNIDIYKQICWYFAGGVFGGNKENLLKFADLMKDKCIDIVTKNNTIMWEVNFWYILYTETSELFEPYMCDHNNSIIDNY
jgi:hypothetical protein